MIPKASTTKTKRDKWDHIELKSFYTETKQKTEPSQQSESSLQNGRKHLQTMYLIRDLPRVHKELLQLNKKTDNPVKNWAKDMSRHFSKQNTQITN